jgi:uncharacterized protein (TIGR02453 family)
VFAGFPPEALTFYTGLAADNTKAYWDAHRDIYEECVREPLELLTLELSREFGAAKVFRPYRDVRFSKDKTPYKTAAAAVAQQDGHELAHRYVELSAGGLRLGGGVWHLEKEQLASTRRAIDADLHGNALERIRADLQSRGISYVAPELKTAPRGYPKDHPRIELLRCKRHAGMAVLAPAPWLHTPGAKDRVAQVWRDITPLLDWIERHVA